MRILLWAVVIALTFYSNNTVAQTCSTIPDCSSLGYTQTASDCINNNYTACPFDTTKVKCHQTKSCANLGYSQAASSCYGGYTACPYDTTKVRCTSTSSCSTLGYNSSGTPNCKKYVRCPHDTRYYKCLESLNVGDIKYTAAESSDHDGWWKVNGRSFNPDIYADLYKALGSSATTIPATPTGAAGNAFIYVGQDDRSDVLAGLEDGTIGFITLSGGFVPKADLTLINKHYDGKDTDGDGVVDNVIDIVGFIYGTSDKDEDGFIDHITVWFGNHYPTPILYETATISYDEAYAVYVDEKYESLYDYQAEKCAIMAEEIFGTRMIATISFTNSLGVSERYLTTFATFPHSFALTPMEIGRTYIYSNLDSAQIATVANLLSGGVGLSGDIKSALMSIYSYYKNNNNTELYTQYQTAYTDMPTALNTSNIKKWVQYYDPNASYTPILWPIRFYCLATIEIASIL